MIKAGAPIDGPMRLDDGKGPWVRLHPGAIPNAAGERRWLIKYRFKNRGFRDVALTEAKSPDAVIKQLKKQLKDLRLSRTYFYELSEAEFRHMKQVRDGKTSAMIPVVEP